MTTTVITNIQSLPASPFENMGVANIVITSGVPTYFQVKGTYLDNIVSFNWYPENPYSLLFEIRQLILVDDLHGTIMVKVIDNYLNINDRAGYLGFRLKDGTSINYPVKTYGPVSIMPLWRPSSDGLKTG